MRRRVTVVSCFIDILHLRSVEYLRLLVRASIFLYSNESIGQEDLRIISALKKTRSFRKTASSQSYRIWVEAVTKFANLESACPMENGATSIINPWRACAAGLQ